MNIYLNCTSNLGDFVNGLPVLSGLAKIEPIHLTVKADCKKFKGFRDFLMVQGLFTDVKFDDEPIHGLQIILSGWTHEFKGDPLRPTETCRYENWIRDHYPSLIWQVDDDFELIVPARPDVLVPEGYIAGDRWHHKTDPRRRENLIAYLHGVTFLDFNQDLLTNCWIIQQSKLPFISCFTGIAIIADLMKKEVFVVWKPEDYNEEFRQGPRDVFWNNKNIQQEFEAHYYGNRKAKLIHALDLGEFG